MNNLESLAKMLDGRKCGEETTPEIEAFAKDNGLIIAFGCSDDLLEVRGVFCEEYGAHDGKEILVDGTRVSAFWNPPLSEKTFNKCCSWMIDSESEEKKYFKIWEDEKLYCVGVVFEPLDREEIKIELSDEQFDHLKDYENVTVLIDNKIFKIGQF